jgi:hypothetical protein
LLLSQATPRRFGLQRLAPKPVSEPVLAVVVVEREQPPDPDHRVPLGEPELIGDALIFVTHDEAVEIIKVAKDPDAPHPWF